MATSQSQLDIIIKAVKEGQGVEQTVQQLEQLKTKMGDSTKEVSKLSQAQNVLRQALASVGLTLTAAELIKFGSAAREASRAEEDAINALRTAAKGIADYEQALNLGRQATKGMASDQELAAAQAVLFGTGLATNAEQAAQLASAGTVLSQVFASAGASQELFVRLLSSGSQVLYNNFGLTAQMVNKQQKLVESTTALRGEEAKSQALKDILIQQANKYQASLSAESIAAAQSAASWSNFSASFGNLINQMDQATGTTNTITAALNQMTAGAKAYSDMLAQASDMSFFERLSVGMQVQAGVLAELTGLADIHATSIADMTEAQREYALSTGAVTQAQIDEALAIAETTSAIAGWVSSANAMGLGTEQLADATQQSAAAARLHAHTLEELAEARKKDDPIANAQKERVRAAAYREEAAAVEQLADARQRDLDIQRNASRAAQDLRSKKEAAPELGAKITEQRQAVFEIQEQQRKEEEAAAKRSETLAKQQAKSITQAFDKVGSDIASAVSSAVSQSSTDIAGLLGLNAEGEQRVNEGVRRMAAVATGGLANEWTQQLASQLQGVDAAQAFVNAVAGGNDTAVREEARKLATNPIVELFDANAIAGQIEQQLRAQQLQQLLNDRVNALLGERGLQAVTNVTQQIAGVATDTQTATAGVGETTTQLGATAEVTGERISASFKAAIPQVDLLNDRFRLMAGLIERVNTLAGQAAGNISAMNPPQAGAANDAANKMGGNSPL